MVMDDALVLVKTGRAMDASCATRCWLAVLLLCAGQFMDVLDFSIVTIALPAIGRDLRFSLADLPWVVNAYALTLGGCLLLGGAIADLIGRRRTFMAGLALATLAALVGGLATSSSVLVTARAAQGLGMALLSPAALALITTTVPAGPDRTRALGVWGGVASAGLAAGVLLGGLLTAGFGWRAVMLVNVPIGLAALVLTPVLLSEGRVLPPVPLDIRGAVLVTGGLVALVATLAQAGRGGILAPTTLSGLALTLVLLGTFVASEARGRAPLVPLHILWSRVRATATLSIALSTGAFAAVFLLLSLYLQQAGGYTAFTAGLAFLPLALVGLLASATLAPWLVARYSARATLTTGLLLVAGAGALLARLPITAAYLVDVLPAMFALAIGQSIAFTAATASALAGVRADEQGVASGVLNTAIQVGAAAGIALLVAAATGATPLHVRDAASVYTVVRSVHIAGAAGAVLAGVGALLAWIVMGLAVEHG